MVVGQGAVEVAGLLGHEAAVLHRVAEADGGVGAGLHAAPALGGAGEVEAEEGGGVGALGLEAEAGAAVGGVGEDGLGREDAGAEGLLAVVEVDEEGVDEAGALAEAGLEGCPLLGGEDEGAGLEFPEVVGGAAGGVVGVGEVGEGGVADGEAQARAQGAALRGVEGGERRWRGGRRRGHEREAREAGGRRRSGQCAGGARRGKRGEGRSGRGWSGGVIGGCAAGVGEAGLARMLPLWDTQEHRRAAVVTGCVIVACLGIFVYEVALLMRDAAAFEAWLTRHALVPARLLGGWDDPVEWRTVLSSMFLHGSVPHVLGNCWFLWVFGRSVESRLGHAGFACFYLFTGAIAAGAQVLVAPGSSVPMVGASGAISGVLGAYLVFFPRAWVVALVPWIVPIVPIPAVVFLLLWFFVQAQAGVGSLLAGTEAAGGVAWWAHAGGFVAGAALAMCLPRKRRR